jgi:hypothetical protein
MESQTSELAQKRAPYSSMCAVSKRLLLTRFGCAMCVYISGSTLADYIPLHFLPDQECGAGKSALKLRAAEIGCGAVPLNALINFPALSSSCNTHTPLNRIKLFLYVPKVYVCEIPFTLLCSAL